MELFRDTNIDFMKYRQHLDHRLARAAGRRPRSPIFVPGKLNLGIDFAGGTQLTLRFHEPPDVDHLRGLLEQARARRGPDPALRRPDEENQVIIKTAVAEGAGGGEPRAHRGRARAKVYNQGKTGLDLNQIGRDALAQLLVQADPDRVAAQGPEAARDPLPGHRRADH